MVDLLVHDLLLTVVGGVEFPTLAGITTINSAIGLDISLHCGPPISVSNSIKRRFKCQVTTRRWEVMTSLHYERA